MVVDRAAPERARSGRPLVSNVACGSRYDAALRATRTDGDALPWIELCLEAVHSQSVDAVTRAERIVELRERYRASAAKLSSVNALRVVDFMCENPIVTTRLVEAGLGVVVASDGIDG